MAGQAIVLTAFQATTTPVTLCVGVVPLKQSTGRGQAAQWEVGAWAEGGNLPDAKLQLQSTAGAGVPAFTFGCANGNGTPACDLGAVDAGSAQRLFEADVSVPLTAAVTAVSLTVTGTAANLAVAPAASASVVLAAGTASATSSSTVPTITPGGFGFPTPTMSPGGNAAGLFPSLAPTSQAGEESPAANVSALHRGASTLGSEVAEVGGLGALAVAMFLALTRLSWRRPAPRQAAGSAVAAAPPPTAPAAPAAPTAPAAVQAPAEPAEPAERQE